MSAVQVEGLRKEYGSKVAVDGVIFRDLSRERERLREARIEATEIKTVPNVISYFDLGDLDGNTMRWFQVLTSDPKVTGSRE